MAQESLSEIGNARKKIPEKLELDRDTCYGLDLRVARLRGRGGGRYGRREASGRARAGGGAPGAPGIANAGTARAMSETARAKRLALAYGGRLIAELCECTTAIPLSVNVTPPSDCARLPL